MKNSNLEILKYPNKILETKSEVVETPLNTADLELIKNMNKTVQKIGVGLAAPQVGQNKQIFIIHLSEEEDLKKTIKTPDFVVINPIINFYSDAKVDMVEGCLSFPNEYWNISRSKNIKVKFTTILNYTGFLYNNEKPKYGTKELLLKDWVSRIFQHEFDHLMGEIFIKKGGVKIEEDQLNTSPELALVE